MLLERPARGGFRRLGADNPPMAHTTARPSRYQAVLSRREWARLAPALGARRLGRLLDLLGGLPLDMRQTFLSILSEQVAHCDANEAVLCAITQTVETTRMQVAQ